MKAYFFTWESIKGSTAPLPFACTIMILRVMMRAPPRTSSSFVRSAVHPTRRSGAVHSLLEQIYLQKSKCFQKEFLERY